VSALYNAPCMPRPHHPPVPSCCAWPSARSSARAL
jgi:hypothetical protein